MVVFVPFDGSDLSKTALLHASRASNLYEVSTLAFTVIPNNPNYAREKGWIDDTEPFDRETVVSRLRECVGALAPDATFDYETVGRHSSAGIISSRLRRVARQRDTSAIFVGSEKAGHSIIGTTSVGGRVAFEDEYDIAIIRNVLSEVEDVTVLGGSLAT